MKNRSKWVRRMVFLAGILACLGLTACGGGAASAPGTGSSSAGEESETSQTQAAETGAEEEKAVSGKIRIGVLGIADSFPLYAAADQGLFEEQGLDVEIVDFSSASDQSVAYEAGELDGMMTDMIVQSLINKASGENGMQAVAMALGGTPQEGRFLVAASPDSGISQPADLAGKKIGISENTMMEYLVTRYLQDLNVDMAQVELVNIPKLTLRLDSLLGGSDIQAAILPDPLAIEAQERGCEAVIDDTALGKNYSQSVVTLRSAIVRDQPETAAAFLAAYNEAIRRINEDPDSFQELFYEKANVAPDLKGKYTVPSYTADCVPTREVVEDLQDWMVGKGLLDTAFSYEDIVAVQE